MYVLFWYRVTKLLSSFDIWHTFRLHSQFIEWMFHKTWHVSLKCYIWRLALDSCFVTSSRSGSSQCVLSVPCHVFLPFTFFVCIFRFHYLLAHPRLLIGSSLSFSHLLLSLFLCLRRVWKWMLLPHFSQTCLDIISALKLGG